MGSKYSQNNREEKSSEQNYNINQKLNIEPYETSLSIKTNEYTEKSSMTTTTENIDNLMNRVPYKFEWKGEGNQVLLTGDFLDWKGKIIMKKNENTGYFEVVIPLERKKHRFKFIVDGNWTCTNQYPTEPDEHNNLNNFISLNDYYPPKEIPMSKVENIMKNKINLNESIKTEEENNIKNKINVKKEEQRKKLYNCKYPLINELNTLAPIIMLHYKPIFFLDYPSRQDFIKQKEGTNFLTYKEKNFNTENNTYKKIMTCPHEKLMHFCVNLDDIKNIDNDFFRLCTTVRNKHKFLTLIYYKPK